VNYQVRPYAEFQKYYRTPKAQQALPNGGSRVSVNNYRCQTSMLTPPGWVVRLGGGRGGSRAVLAR